MKKIWNRITSRWASFKEWQHRNIKNFRIGFAATILACMALLFAGTKFAPEQITVNGLTKVGDVENFDNGSGSIKLNSQRYNPIEKVMVLGFKTNRQVSSADNLPIPETNLSFGLTTVNKEAATMQIIPTTSDQITVVIRKLNPNFGAMKVSIKNSTPDSSDIQNNSNSSKGSNAVDFKFKNDGKQVDNSLVDMSKKDFAIAATENEITRQKSLIANHKKIIKQSQKVINTDYNNINSQNKDDPYNTKSEKAVTKSSVDSLNDDIKTQRETIGSEKAGIKNDRKKIDLLNQQILDIQSGKYKLTGTISSSQSKNLN